MSQAPIDDYEAGRKAGYAEGYNERGQVCPTQHEPRILTCVYCGLAYPQGTPPHSSSLLTDHIEVCPKHPMAELTQKYDVAVGKVNYVVRLIGCHAGTDGAHHKQWVFDQIVGKLLGVYYDDWVAEWEHTNEDHWDEGIAP